MKTPVRFAKGDSVLHPRRPEWGTGRVRETAALAQPDGRLAQRLTVDFANRGRVVLNTAVAPLIHQATAPPVAKRTSPRLTPSQPIVSTRSAAPAYAGVGARSGGSDDPAGAGGFASPVSSGGSGGWLAALDKSTGNAHELWELPPALTDVFASLGDRLKATLQTYKYSTQPRALMDWAVLQTGLSDPLSKYTRHELEQAFPRFARDRDQHLRDLIRQIKRQDDFATLKEAGRGLFPAAQSALDKAIRG